MTGRVQEAFEDRADVAEAIAYDRTAPGLEAVDHDDDGLSPVFQPPQLPA